MIKYSLTEVDVAKHPWGFVIPFALFFPFQFIVIPFLIIASKALGRPIAINLPWLTKQDTPPPTDMPL